YGPYRQSERTDLYRKYLEKLIAEDKAYFCFCSEQDLEAEKQYQMSQGLSPHYSGKCAGLDKKTVKQYLAEGKPSIIRFRITPKKVAFDDLIRGRLEFDASLMGDIIIAKSLDAPLYNFAAVVDDFEMKISHILRGEEHISNTPKQILIQEALGFPQPLHGHLPLILNEDRTKMSKREGATSVFDFRKEGYLSEALVNFMAFLGWNPGDEREIYSLASLVKEFSLEKIQKGGAVFNIKRLDFLNGFYIRQRSPEKLAELCLPYLTAAGLTNIDSETLVKIVSIYQERLKRLSEIVELADFFFKDKLDYDKNMLKWKEISDKEAKDSLDKLEKLLSKIKDEDWQKEKLESVLLQETEKTNNRGALLWPLRVALTAKEASAGPFEIAEILGKEKSLKRIQEAKKLF
ncbi:MAG: glutamate--tRNA ligase, partial [Candidatus Nealsonbacteria bacterium RBG_13_38_11]